MLHKVLSRECTLSVSRLLIFNAKQFMAATNLANGALSEPSYLTSGDPGMSGGGTVNDTQTRAQIDAYENIFGPAARDIKYDSQRNKRHQRWHLPDALRGPNSFLTDRIDGLITDATNKPCHD